MKIPTQSPLRYGEGAFLYPKKYLPLEKGGGGI